MNADCLVNINRFTTQNCRIMLTFTSLTFLFFHTLFCLSKPILQKKKKYPSQISNKNFKIEYI